MSSHGSSASDGSAVPSDALIQMLEPDGYYAYFGIEKGTDIDEDAIKKTYRKLSLKHHPDKPSGDAETFRMLNRAQKVLLNPKVRQQYDILGLDLDDDDEEHKHEEAGAETTTSQGIVHEVASMALTAVLQLGIRTAMMAFVSLVIVRYRWTLFPALLFLAVMAYRIHAQAAVPGSANSSLDVLSPFLIGTGLWVMHISLARWGFYLLGEALVIGMFTYNSMGPTESKRPAVLIAIGIFSLLMALWFRGKFWNYAIIIGLEFFLALFIAMAFPIMEMVLEAVLNEKLQKVGVKVRQHHEQIKRYYANNNKS